MVIETFLQSTFSFLRLIIYPLLAISIITFALSGENGGRAKSVKFHILIAIIFIILWGTSVIAYITKDNSIVINFNNFTLIPTLIILLFYTWKITIDHNREWLNYEMEEKQP